MPDKDGKITPADVAERYLKMLKDAKKEREEREQAENNE